VFAPAAAHVAGGVDPSALGPPVADLVALTLPQPAVQPGRVAGEVLAVDGFGNLQLNVRRDDLERAGARPGAPVTVTVGAAVRQASLCTTFADVAAGGLALLEDSFGRMALVVNAGDAAGQLGAGPGDPVRIELAGPQAD
ncbi:MAG TPA: SAM hydroxide adenosyltransferase, partial [Egibacteraceae bacterium]|nr:SAM hydroxide adenosyltransferase [Egibacteraceae bacterium]